MASSEDSRADTKPLFNFLIKVPNNIFDNSILDEPEIPIELELDEKRKAWEAILFQLNDKRISTDIHVLNCAHVKAKYLSASEFVQSKITEVESLQSVVDKAEHILSTGEISNQICEIDKYIIHKEEPGKLERKMALDQLRIILSDNAGQASECANSEHEIRRITELKAKAEESLKIARKELDILKESALKAEAAVLELEKQHDDDMKQIEHLKDESIAVDDDCEAVKAKLEIVREKRSQRMSVLFDYMEDAAYYKRYPEQLSVFCRSSVENFMKLWNEDEEFRRQYVRMMEKDEMVSDEVDVAASEMDEIKQETITENTNWKTKKEKDEMVSDDVEVAASEMDEIKQEAITENTNWKVKKEKDEMVSDEADVAASEMDEIKQETITENTNWKTETEKDKMVSDDVEVAASEMDEIKQETIIENTNWKTKKVDAQAKNKKVRGKKKR